MNQGKPPGDRRGPDSNPEGPARPAKAYPVKTPEARVTRRQAPPGPARNMPGTDKQPREAAPPVTMPTVSLGPAPGSSESSKPNARPVQGSGDSSRPAAQPVQGGVQGSSDSSKPAVRVSPLPPRQPVSDSDRATMPPTRRPQPGSNLPPARARVSSDAQRPVSSGAQQPSGTNSQRPIDARLAVTEAGLPPAYLRPGGPTEQGLPPVRSPGKASPPPPMPTIGEHTEKLIEPVGERTEIPGPVDRDVTKVIQYRAEKDPALADTQDMDPVPAPPPAEATGSEARISFGQAAVMLKLVTPAQIQECVNVQRALLAKGQRVPLLGQILLERGHLDKPGIEKIKSHQQMYQMADKIPGYRLYEKLGQGAMGTVYKAKQVRMERWVAIKILQPELAANATIKERFLQEARASARLNHPNVITGIDAGEVTGLCYFAMEYVEGKTLQQLVKERGAMDERQALDAVLQVSRALEHAEKLSLVHRDVKPDNIMITRDRQVKLLDLGLAKVRADGESGATRGMAVGTPNYISPEQAMGRQDIDTRSDIYSLGVTFYFMLTGRVPFEGPPEVVMYRHIHEPPPHPKNFRPDLMDATCVLIQNMMSKRPEDRPASAAQLVSDIEHLQRTGKLPGFFDGAVAPGSLKVNKDSRAIVVNKRNPNLRGYGMPSASSQMPAVPQPQAPAPSQQPAPDGGAPRLPRKRRKRFGGGW